MYRTGAHNLGDIIRRVIKQKGLNKGLEKTRVIKSWESVAGSTAGRYTEKIYIIEDTLFVHLSSPIIRYELSGKREYLREALNNASGAETIKNIVLK